MRILNMLTSRIDNTLKYQMLTWDDYIIECCVIFFDSSPAKINFCVSSQVGCECCCSFCATGYKKFIRNLHSDEIIEQVRLILENRADLIGESFEITYMGTGEPLNNKEEVFKSAFIFNQTYDKLVRINISSVFAKMNLNMDEVEKFGKKLRLQYSMHFLTDLQRRQYFRKNLVPIIEVLTFLDQMAEKNQENYCINYILFNDINDRKEDAKELTDIIKQHRAYLKLSHYCPIDASDLKASSRENEFIKEIQDTGIKWKYFSSHGTDIHAACGHLLTDIIF